MENYRPRVSIGLAVFNGERYLAQAIDSILAQTFTDFELILSDNASTDRTQAICRKYAAQDKRIRYYRNAENIGGANNENQTFRLSKGEFFRWAADDDVCAPELIEQCVEVLDHNPAVVLCYTMLTEIDEQGKSIKTLSQKKGMSPSPAERLRDLSAPDHNCEATYGVIRADILRKTRLEQNYTDSDRTLLCELALYGQFYEIPVPLFYKRYHARNMYLDMRARMVWFDPSLKGKIVLPYWMQFFDYLGTIQRVPLSWQEKVKCYINLLPWLRLRGKRMAKDLFLALYAFVDPSGWQKRNERLYNWE